MKLLEKMRKINALLQKSEKVDFNVIAGLLSQVIHANTCIAGEDGSVRGYALTADTECGVMRSEVLAAGSFPKAYVSRMNRLKETCANIPHENGSCSFLKQKECLHRDEKTTIVPILGKSERLGTLIMTKYDQPFSEEDLLLAEHAAAVVGMEIMHERQSQIAARESRRAVMQVAIASLSYSEYEAIMSVLEALQGSEGLLVTSKIADNIGITRSVIVNALRKFASAGLIESKSLGMKGTYIKVKNEFLLELVKQNIFEKSLP